MTGGAKRVAKKPAMTKKMAGGTKAAAKSAAKPKVATKAVPAKSTKAKTKVTFKEDEDETVPDFGSGSGSPPQVREKLLDAPKSAGSEYVVWKREVAQWYQTYRDMYSHTILGSTLFKSLELEDKRNILATLPDDTVITVSIILDGMENLYGTLDIMTKAEALQNYEQLERKSTQTLKAFLVEARRIRTVALTNGMLPNDKYDGVQLLRKAKASAASTAQILQQFDNKKDSSYEYAEQLLSNLAKAEFLTGSTSSVFNAQGEQIYDNHYTNERWASDWQCRNCQFTNFSKRKKCMKCGSNAPRTTTTSSTGHQHHSSHQHQHNTSTPQTTGKGSGGWTDWSGGGSGEHTGWQDWGKNNWDKGGKGKGKGKGKGWKKKGQGKGKGKGKSGGKGKGKGKGKGHKDKKDGKDWKKLFNTLIEKVTGGTEPPKKKKKTGTGEEPGEE